MRISQIVVEDAVSYRSAILSIQSSLGSKITNLYDSLERSMKSFYVNVDSDRAAVGNDGWKFIEGGRAATWMQSDFLKLKSELYDLCKLRPQQCADLISFLRDNRGTKWSFNTVQSELPMLIAKTARNLKEQRLEQYAQTWIERVRQLAMLREKLQSEHADFVADRDRIPKQPKDNRISQQNAQIEQIINSVLAAVPKDVAGSIRQAISKADNKLQALQQELSKRNIKM